MSDLIEVDDFLAHYGVTGMKWGKRRARSDDRSGGRNPRGGSGDKPKPKMSREKKIAIAVGIGATVAIGAAITIAILNNKGGSNMNIPVHTLSTNTSMLKGKASLITNAASMNAREYASASASAARQIPKAMPKVNQKAIAKAQAQAQAISKSMPSVPGKKSLGDKVKDAAVNKAKDMLFERAKEQAMDKVKTMAFEKAKSMMGRPAASIPPKSVVFNPKTGLYEEVPAEAEKARA